MPSYEESEAYQTIVKQHDEKYKSLGISKEQEAAVIQALADLGVLATCYVPGSSSCTGKCPSGQKCISSTRGNCICSSAFN